MHPPVSLNPITKGLAFARFAAALAHCQGEYGAAAAYAAAKWPDQPIIGHTIKAAVGAAVASTSGWSSELVHSGLAADFVEAIRAATVIDRLAGVRRVLFNARVPVETTGTDGTWLGEGAAIPVAASDFTTVSLPPYYAGSISVLDDELIKLMTPRAVELIKNSMIAGAVRYLDRQFLDPTAAAVANVSPGSVTNGAVQITNTGSTAAAMTADFANMIGAADDLISPVWVMNGKTCANIAGTLGLPEVKVIAGFLHGIPILCSKSSPAPVGSPPTPRLITLIDANALLLANEGVADVKVTNVAALQQDDAPTNNAADGTAIAAISLFQVSAWAAKVVRQISWARTRTAGAVWMEVSY